MNTFSCTSLIRTISGGLPARVVLGLILMGAFLIAGAGLVGASHLESASTSGEFFGPVMPMLPVVTVFIFNIQP
jgi:hypothetical protein